MTKATEKEQLHYNPHPAILSDDTSVRRISVRPLRYRDANFDEKYDSQTLFYDAFWDTDHNYIILVAPPFRNLRSAVDGMNVLSLPSNQKCSFRIVSLDRHSQVWVDAPKNTENLTITTSFGTFRLRVSQNLSPLFAGRRVLLTKSKNNLIEWIRDWSCFYRDTQSADAILLYDNNSTIYTSKELAHNLATLSGFSQILVVNWPFKFGPQGDSRNRHWDSDYCEFAILEHARRMFLSEADGVINCDIDELLVSNSNTTVFEAVKSSYTGVLTYRGVWMPGVKDITRIPCQGNPIRHRDFYHHTKVTKKLKYGFIPKYMNRGAKKWTVVPRRCPNSSQWGTHRIRRWLPSYIQTRAFSFRHFREISTSWKYDRAEREIFSPERHIGDKQLLQLFDKVNWDA